MTFNLILLKLFASGLGPKNIEFLLGAGLEKQHSTYSNPDDFFILRKVSSSGPWFPQI